MLSVTSKMLSTQIYEGWALRAHYSSLDWEESSRRSCYSSFGTVDFRLLTLYIIPCSAA